MSLNKLHITVAKYSENISKALSLILTLCSPPHGVCPEKNMKDKWVYLRNTYKDAYLKKRAQKLKKRRGSKKTKKPRKHV